VTRPMTRGARFCKRTIELERRHAQDLHRAGNHEAAEAIQRLAELAREALAEGGDAPANLMYAELQRLVPLQRTQPTREEYST
jgi:hypothetical protein